jgi:hypothetical protein
MTRVAARMLGPLDRLLVSRCLVGRRLPCGCDVGLYEKTDGEVLTIVDEPDDTCPDRAHQADFVIDRASHPGR